MYVYLAPQGNVLTFEADPISVLPGDGEAKDVAPSPYTRSLEFGTCIKLYNYQWRAKSCCHHRRSLRA